MIQIKNKSNIFRFIMMFIDVICIIISVGISIQISSWDSSLSFAQYGELYKYVFPFLVLETIPVMFMFKLYSRVWKFASIEEAIQVVTAGAISTILFAITGRAKEVPNIYSSYNAPAFTVGITYSSTNSSVKSST